MAKQLTESELENILSHQIRLAKDHDRSERATPRSKALDYFLGNMDKYVPPEENRSKVVSRDTADTVGWMLPGIMRVFTASDRMAEAEPVDQDDTQFAGQATDGLNHVFWKDNKGYEVVYAATWDALVVGNGIVKTYFDDTPVYTTSFHSGLTEDQVALLLQDEETEVLTSSQEQGMGQDPETGEQIPLVFTDIKIKRKKADGKFVIECIPPEDFLIDEDAICTDEAAFTAHRQQLTRSQLVAMGYDKKDVWAIPEAGRPDTKEDTARDQNQGGEATDKSMERVDYFECYIRIDVDGDGEAELVKACYAGGETGKMLHWEVWEDESPFDDIPCEPIPHRWDARSIADETMDVVDVKTVLLRQALNNIYGSNNPMFYAEGDILNMDVLVNPDFGSVIRGKSGTKLTPLALPFVANHAFEAIAYQDEVIQRRTGVGRQSMALDPEALQNQSATANQNNKDAAYSQIELVARNMAEWGWKKVFRKLLKIMVKHQTSPRTIMLKGKPVSIDPRFWNADMDVTINVGLGTGSRDRDLAMLGRVLETQILMADRFMAAGAMEDAIDMLPKILNTMVKMAESAGLKNPEDYYPEYAEDKIIKLKQLAEQAATQPSPQEKIEQAKIQAQAEVEQLKAQGNAAKEEAQMQADLMTTQQTQDFEREKLAADYQFKMAELAQKREIELLKLGMADVEGEDGQKAPKSKADVSSEMLMEGLAQLGQMVASLASTMNAPTEIVRDPATGKALGTRKVMN